jgi:hypothetical protein
MTGMKSFVIFLLAASAALAQPFGAGVKVGVPLTDFVDAASSGNLSYLAHTNRYVVGPFAEVRLPFSLGIEFDALYRKIDYSATLGNSTTSVTSGAWEFPLLLKYRLHGKIARPFVDGGVAWDTLQGLQESILAGTPIGAPASVRHNTVSGFVLGGGLDVHFLVIHVQPEIRYTRWFDKHFLDPTGLLKSNQNQAEFLVGISF